MLDVQVYDLTYSNTYYGEHTTTVDGEGAKPQEKDLLQVGLQAGLGKVKCQKMISEIREIVGEMLVEYI